MRRFEGRVAVVSGAAQGMGKAVAERLGQEGAVVVAVDINGDGANATAKAIGGKSFGVRLRHRRRGRGRQAVRRPSRRSAASSTCW